MDIWFDGRVPMGTPWTPFRGYDTQEVKIVHHVKKFKNFMVKPRKQGKKEILYKSYGCKANNRNK